MILSPAFWRAPCQLNLGGSAGVPGTYEKASPAKKRVPDWLEAEPSEYARLRHKQLWPIRKDKLKKAMETVFFSTDFLCKIEFSQRGSARCLKMFHLDLPCFCCKCMSRLLALLGPREMSDLSPQSGPKRTLIRSLSPIAIL